jgi:hypothetical protein
MRRGRFKKPAAELALGAPLSKNVKQQLKRWRAILKS